MRVPRRQERRCKVYQYQLRAHGRRAHVGEEGKERNTQLGVVLLSWGKRRRRPGDLQAGGWEGYCTTTRKEKGGGGKFGGD